MPCYYFHVHEGEDILDDEGTELASLDHARAQGLQCG
jgi:hypothetical protein